MESCGKVNGFAFWHFALFLKVRPRFSWEDHQENIKKGLASNARKRRGDLRMIEILRNR